MPMDFLDIFYEISKLNRCDRVYQPFTEYVSNFAKKFGYEVFIDKAHNVLVKKPNSKATITLQSHYDIVCLNDNIPTIIKQDNILKAKNSTLGADNGIGCSYMLLLISQNYDLEYLFTSDEEIGLIGAKNLNLNLQSKYLINLDSEKEGEICIGCAGGVDIIATINDTKLANYSDYFLFEVSIDKLPGGHSGVDIDKNIPNAIKELINFIYQNNGIVLEINGGERINSIPVSAKAIVAFDKKIISDKFNIKFLDNANHISFFDKSIIKFLYEFKNGVLEKDEFGVVSSINLALIKTNINSLEVSFSARSMDNDKLDNIANSLKKELINLGFNVGLQNQYPAWKPVKNQFTSKIENIFKKYYQDYKIYAIHAGLECGILKEKFPNLHTVSIGPNIFYPHSLNECCQISSAKKVFELLKTTINKL